MRPFLIALLLVFSHPVAWSATTEPALRYQDQSMILTLRVGECRSKATRKHIPPEHLPNFHAADLTWKGKQLQACWMLWPGQDSFLIVDETGDFGSLPMSVFRPVSYL